MMNDRNKNPRRVNKIERVRVFVLPLLILCLCAAGCQAFRAAKAALPQTSSRIHFISCGYADAALIEHGNVRLLIDAADKSAARKLLRYLRMSGVNRLDAVIITHPHDNHYGGLASLLNALPIEAIYHNGQFPDDAQYRRLVKKIKAKGIPFKALRAGDSLRIGDIKANVMHPERLGEKDPNENSLVLKIHIGRAALLFSGDVTDSVQNELVRRYGKKLSAHLVTIPHHGDKMSEAWWKLFRRSYKVISTGPYVGPHRVTSPHPDTISRMDERTYRTDRDGDLVFGVEGSTLKRED